jgi:hypothetical protein
VAAGNVCSAPAASIVAVTVAPHGRCPDFYTAADNDTLAFKAIEQDGDAFRLVIRERLRSLKRSH